MRINLDTTPFSAYGSYFGISRVWAPNPFPKTGLALRSMHGLGPNRCIFFIEQLTNSIVHASIEECSPTLLKLISDKGTTSICFEGPKTVRFNGTGIGLHLRFCKTGDYDSVFCENPSAWVVNSSVHGTKYRLTLLSGDIKVTAPINRTTCEYIDIEITPDKESHFDLIIEDFKYSLTPSLYCPFAQAIYKSNNSYQTWLTTTLAVPAAYGEQRELASYLLWASTIEPGGHIKRDSILMSKNHMSAIWSWDHCFNAMAVAASDPALAWDQLMVVFDNQDASGMLPDLFNESTISWNFVKPPIHGWALAWMLRRYACFGDEHLNEIYEPLVKLTNWWFDYYDLNRNGFPEYRHGNDCGWDNATIFLREWLIEAPDVTSFLVLQMATLATIALRLGKEIEGLYWQKRSDDLLSKMIDYFWRDEQFHVFSLARNEFFVTQSLFHYLPLVLGKKLPEGIAHKMVTHLTNDGFLTPYGLATENPRSDYYNPDGYWRGPIWAPVTMLIVDGLRERGYLDLSKDIARRYCDLVKKSGCAENYNALTGDPLCDRTYTWSASVFLILANEYL